MNSPESNPRVKSGPNTEHNVPRTFPLPGTTYYNMIYDPKSKKEFHTNFKIANRIIAPLYKLQLLPLLGFGKLVLLLTTKGRKSGRMRDTPIGYFRCDNAIYILSGWGKEADWYKNILAYPDDVYIQVGFHRFHACAEPVQDREELKQMMKRLVKHHTNGPERRAMGWDPKRDDPETADFSGMFEKTAIVQLLERS